MTTTLNGTEAITVRANLKAIRIRPAREPGDKPVFEFLLRSEVSDVAMQLGYKAGREMTVHLVPDPEVQPRLIPDAAEAPALSMDAEEDEVEQPVTVPSAGRRRRGTRTPELQRA
jgi:hypothetical protein